MQTVESLRKEGYGVLVHHNRNLLIKPTYYEVVVTGNPKKLGVKSDKILPRGGFTKVTIKTPDGREFCGVAKCSDNDNYNKKIGVAIAIGRALKGLENV